MVEQHSLAWGTAAMGTLSLGRCWIPFCVVDAVLQQSPFQV